MLKRSYNPFDEYREIPSLKALNYAIFRTAIKNLEIVYEDIEGNTLYPYFLRENDEISCIEMFLPVQGVFHLLIFGNTLFFPEMGCSKGGNMLENVRSVGKDSYQNKILSKVESGKTKESQKVDKQASGKEAELAKATGGKEAVVQRDSLELSGREKEVAAKGTQANKAEKTKALSAEEGLSDKAKTYLKNLRRSRNFVDFRIAEKGKENDALAGKSNKEFTVVLSNEEIEKMAMDKKFEREQLNTLDQTVKSMLMAQTGIGNDNGANKTNVEDIKSIAAKTQEDGTTMLIASLEKSTSSARKIAEEQDKKREAKKLEEKQEAKRAAEKEALKGGKKANKAQKAEKADSKDKLSGTEKTKEGATETERIHDVEKTAVKRVEVRGRTIEELMENLKKLDWTKVPVTE